MQRNKSEQNGQAIVELPASIADRANAEHAACLAAASDALDHAMRAGDLLAEAKSGCEHGQWQQWLADNFDGSVRLAQSYMRLAVNREQFAKTQTSAHLSIDSALKLLASPAVPDDDLMALGPEWAAIADEMLNGPFCPEDFAQPVDLTWLKTKISHQAKLPPIVGFALTTDVATEMPIMRAVPFDDLVEAVRILAPYASNRAGFKFFRPSIRRIQLLEVVVALLMGKLLVEFDYRKKLESEEQYEAEAVAACDQLVAACQSRISELEGAN